MTTNEKGDIGVTVVIAEAAKRGYSVLLPISAHKQYDLVLEKDGKFLKVQVKCSREKDGV